MRRGCGKRTRNERQRTTRQHLFPPLVNLCPRKIYRPLTRSINHPRIPSLSGALNGKTNLNLFAEDGVSRKRRERERKRFRGVEKQYASWKILDDSVFSLKVNECYIFFKILTDLMKCNCALKDYIYKRINLYHGKHFLIIINSKVYAMHLSNY